MTQKHAPKTGADILRTGILIMNINSSSAKAPFYIIFGAIAFLTVAFLLFKPVMKLFYPVKHIELIEKYSNEYDLNKYTVMAIIYTESKFNEDAVSHKNAKGLMQLKEETALWCMEKFGIDPCDEDIHSPELNIQVGCAYLRYLLDKFKNKSLAYAAYNAGEGNVTKWLKGKSHEAVLKTIPYAETKKYVDTVNKRTKIYRFLY